VGDVRATVDGRPIPLESLQWIDVTTPTVVPEGAVQPVAAGRSLVFLFQKDVTGTRAAGLLRMASRAKEIARSLPAPDRVAVVSFDSRLRLWTDFTTDRERVGQAIDRGVLMNRTLPKAATDGAALEVLLAADAARRAYSLEKALGLVGKALASVPGERSLVLVGSNMGRSPTVLLSEAEYMEAQQALSDARVAVYSLDVTEADHHTLEAGLQQVAADTGGFYARTHDFTAQAVDKLKGALEGHYLLTFAKPDGPRGYHEVKLRLARGGATVLAHGGYSD
jgi:VWFA-related protein